MKEINLTPFDRLFSIMTKPMVMAAYFGFIVLSFFYLDKPIANYFRGFNPRINLPVLNWITLLGAGSLYLLLFFTLALFFRYIYKVKQWEKTSWFLWFCVLIPSGICLVIKRILGRARPDAWFSHHYYGFYGWHSKNAFLSFPSGHTTTVMGCVFGLCIVFPRFSYGFILAGLAVAATRIFLIQHYLSDVLAGIYLALLGVGLLVWIIKKINLRHTPPAPLAQSSDMRYNA